MFTSPQVKTLFEFVRFLIVGFVGFLISLSITIFLTEYMHFWYIISFIIGMAVAWTTVFLINFAFTFDTTPGTVGKRKFLRFILIYTFIAGLNALIVYILTSLFFPYALSIAITGLITPYFAYMLVKRYVFNGEKEARAWENPMERVNVFK